jgi:exodeoxyribonuclease VII small subunit
VANKTSTEEPTSFEESLEKLEQVVRQLEDGQLGLSESLAQYEEGVRHLKHCHRALAAAERKIELLTAVDEAGNAKTEPFGDEDLAAEQKTKSRSSRRSTRTASLPDDDETGDVDTQRGLF